jgi:hypothetical protein
VCIAAEEHTLTFRYSKNVCRFIYIYISIQHFGAISHGYRWNINFIDAQRNEAKQRSEKAAGIRHQGEGIKKEKKNWEN